MANGLSGIMTLMKLKTKLPALFPRAYWGGIFVIVAISAFYFLSLQALWQYGQHYSWQDFVQDRYLHHVIAFSFLQASLSAFLAVILGFLFARAFFYQDFYGKKWVLKLFSLTFVLPSLVAIFGLMGVYGHNGWLAQTWRLLGFQGNWHFYGLTGILIAHLFFNLPLASRLFLQALQSIPTEQRQLASQLGVRGWRFIQLIEWPYLKQQLFPTFVLIFMLCFTSFAIVLTLGGGPKFTTLEVAIYQAIFFEFDLAKATIFALLQFVFCLALFSLSSLFSPKPTTALSYKTWREKQSKGVQLWQKSLIALTLFFIASPLLHTFLQALMSGEFFRVWQNPEFWRALLYSLSIAPLAGFLAVLIAMALLYFSRLLSWRHHPWLSHYILNTGMVILAIPTLVLALGLFLLLRKINVTNALLFLLVVVCNALMALPFVLRVLTLPMNNAMLLYEKLCQSLQLQGFARFKLIEWPNLKGPLKYAFALASALSLGDFTAIALFANQTFTSLPQLLYQQLARYQMNSASVTAFLLLLFCGLIFYFVESYDQSKHSV